MSVENPTGSADNRRRATRKYMLFKIPAYDGQSRRFLGLVQDITDSGVQLFGVQVEANTTRTLIIQASDYIKSAPLEFDAVCRWSRRENPQGYYVSGFEIVNISAESRESLTKLIDFITLG
ncbi:MAG: PilZ domain-containing protein [Desulfomonile tiedjei]|nr:PilZ domain-containing protein [Desulfomonile tiedjei]